MKLLSDTQIKKHLLSITKDQLEQTYLPRFEQALQDYEANPNVVPERTVLTLNYPGCDTTHLFMPCAAPHSVGTKVISGGSYNSQNGLGFQGFTAVLDPRSGQLLGAVNAKTLTAFRTALASFSAIWKLLKDSDTAIEQVTVIGTGPQAFWHVFLVLRAFKVKKVVVLSRSEESAQKLCKEIGEVDSVETEAFANSSCVAGEKIRKSAIVFGCSPSTEPTIKKEFVNIDPAFFQVFALIGSYKPHMVELDPQFVKDNFFGEYKVIVDSKEHTLAEAGELVQSERTEKNLVSLTDLLGDKAQGRVKLPSGVSVVKIVGLLIMDIYMAQLMLESVEAPQVDFD